MSPQAPDWAAIRRFRNSAPTAPATLDVEPVNQNGEAEISLGLMKAIKAALDPKNIMNPGKVI